MIKMNRSLKMKFLIPTIALIIIGMGISSLISYTTAKKALSDALVGQMTQITESTVTFLSSWINDRKHEVLSWSKLGFFQSALQEGMAGEEARISANAFMKHIKDEYNYYETICIADLSGIVIAAAVPETIGKINVTDRQYFKESIKGNIFISDVLKSKATGNPITCISTPIKAGNKVVGVAFSVVDMNSFSREFIDPIKIGDTGYGYIFNQAGYIVSHPDKQKILNTNINEYNFGPQMIRMEDGLMTYVLDGHEKIVAFRKFKETGWTVAVSGVTQEIFAPINTLRTMNTLLSILIVLVAGIVIFFIANSVVRPINDVVAGLRDAAEGDGDLTKRLTVKSQDEVGELARWFNTFIERIQMIIKEVSQNAGQLSGASKALAAISAQVSSGAEQMAVKARSVSAAGEEMSSSMETVSMTMDRTTNNITMVATSTEEMEATINEIAQNTEKARNTTNSAVKQAETASSQMNVLGNAAKDIEKVIGTITEISEQVNLLALNATIEAARAGEAGKGFAVVANEIKELAGQTSAATGEIKQRVSAIQGSSESTIKEIEAISTVVNTVNEIVTSIAAAIEEQSVATREISGNVSEASSGMNEVNANVTQSSGLSNDIASEIAEVTQSINEMANNSAQINTNSVELSGMAEKLNALVGRFKV